MNVHWYPGHMAKAKRLLQEQIKLVDLVIDVRDARIPFSSSNPDLAKIIGDKQKLIVLNKADLADPKTNLLWKNYFIDKEESIFLINAKGRTGISDLLKKIEHLADLKLEKLKKKGYIFKPIRAMVVGIPNVGKSSLINALIKKNSTKTGNKPGVTRGKQWVKILRNLELLDTPGVLWPKFENKEIGINLAATGAVNDEVYDIVEIAGNLLVSLAITYPERLAERYKIEVAALGNEKLKLLEAIANKRGLLSHGGVVEYEKVATIILQEFRQGKLGKISLESPEKDKYIEV